MPNFGIPNRGTSQETPFLELAPWALPRLAPYVGRLDFGLGDLFCNRRHTRCAELERRMDLRSDHLARAAHRLGNLWGSHDLGAAWFCKLTTTVTPPA